MLTVEPQPVGLTNTLDAEGNNVAIAWFNGLYDHLRIRAEIEIETIRENPYDYLLTPSNNRFPIEYPVCETSALAHLRQRQPGQEPGRSVADFAEQIHQSTNGQVIPFLRRLCDVIHDEFEIIRREEGPPHAPAVTLEMRCGACRDVAVLFIDACRVLGLAARFVSGYQEGDADQVQRDLHAWAEVYLPGTGWRGYDPTNGLAVADRHLAVSASASPELTIPIIGTFRGDDVTAQIHVNLELEFETSVN
jgi:transglutaminase-like putative cysteine protease